MAWSQKIVMKKALAIFSVVMFGILPRSFAQSDEAQQLLLNVEKLAQLKQILSDLKKGYTIVSTGYDAIRNISAANFSLHKTFLDGLLEVSTTVRNYRKIGQIINFQLAITTESKRAFKRFKGEGNLNIDEIEYLGKVYNNLLSESLRNLDALTDVIRSDKLRMSDDERLSYIDSIYDDILEKLQFLRQFNNNTSILLLQRARERKDTRTLKSIYGLNK
jgi:hypothetical protein